MSCTRRFLNIKWEHHHWQRRVTGAETMTAQEPDMWARPVYRDYTRCDKEDVCTECGAVRHQVSCVCEHAKGERCPLLLEWKASNAQRGSAADVSSRVAL